MANILLASYPSDGHVNPMIPLARELVSRQHQIAWYTGKKYQPMVEKLGIEYKPIVESKDISGLTKIEAWPELEGLRGLDEFKMSWKLLFIDTAIHQFRDMQGILEQFPAEVIIAEETFFGASLLHEKTGIPWVMIASGIYIFPSVDAAPIGLALPPDNSFLGKLRNRFMNFMSGNIILADMKKAGNALRQQAGLPPGKWGAPFTIIDEPDLYLMGTIPSFEYPRSDMLKQTHFVGPFVGEPPRNFEPPVWWDDLNTDKPVIHVTQGTANNDVKDLILPTIKALANEDVLLVVSTGNASLDKIDLKTLPKNVRIEKFISHYHLLPCVDVMITNGGYGGIQTALSNGVPLVVIAETEEKPENGRRIEWAGVGVYIKARTASEQQVRDAVRKVLDNPSYAQKAKQIQEEYSKYNAPQKAANLIEELIAKKKA